MIHAIETTSGKQAASLQAFERQFWYPLGPSNSFRIEHGADYTRFFRAMGPAKTFCDERDGQIRGVVSVALRRVRQPSGAMVDAAYFADLKVLPGARGGPTAARLLQHASAWARQHATCAYALVMGGTAALPTRYTGRLGIPACAELTRVQLLRIPVVASESCDLGGVKSCSPHEVHRRFAELTPGAHIPEAGFPERRSLSPPTAYVLAERTACGILEDTRGAKRLFDRDEQEIASAHLSRFAFRSPGAGATLLRFALSECRRRHFPALFVAVSPAQAEPLLESLGIADVVTAPVIVFGHGFVSGVPWSIDTSEI